MTTSRETEGMNHPKIRELVDQAIGLSADERQTLVKGLIPSLARELSPTQFQTFVDGLRIKGERFYDAKEHPGEGRAARNIRGEREVEGR